MTRDEYQRKLARIDELETYLQYGMGTEREREAWDAESLRIQREINEFFAIRDHERDVMNMRRARERSDFIALTYAETL